MALGSAWDGSAWLRMVRNCTELQGVADDDPGRVKPKKFDREPARRNRRTHRGGLGP